MLPDPRPCWLGRLCLSLAKMPYGVNAFEISDNQEGEAVAANQAISRFRSVTCPMKGDVKEKNSPAAGYRVCFRTSSPDFLNVRARSASLFL